MVVNHPYDYGAWEHIFLKTFFLTWAKQPEDYHIGNWGIQVIDGCSLMLCVANLSVESYSVAPQNKLNSALHDSSMMVQPMFQWSHIVSANVSVVSYSVVPQNKFNSALHDSSMMVQPMFQWCHIV